MDPQGATTRTATRTATTRMRFSGIRNRSSRSRRPALACAAAVLVAGLGGALFDDPAEVRPTGNFTAEQTANARHMPAE